MLSLGKRKLYIGSKCLVVEIYTDVAGSHFCKVSEKWVNDVGRFFLPEGDELELDTSVLVLNTTRPTLAQGGTEITHNGDGATPPVRRVVKKIYRKVNK